MTVLENHYYCRQSIQIYAIHSDLQSLFIRKIIPCIKHAIWENTVFSKLHAGYCWRLFKNRIMESYFSYFIICTILNNKYIFFNTTEYQREYNFGDLFKIIYVKYYSLFSDSLLAKHKQSLTELIRRDKNHPSVIMWSIANEPRTQYKAADAYFRCVLLLTVISRTVIIRH